VKWRLLPDQEGRFTTTLPPAVECVHLPYILLNCAPRTPSDLPRTASCLADQEGRGQHAWRIDARTVPPRTVASMGTAAIEPRQITTGVYLLAFAVTNVYVWDWNDGITLIDTGIPGSAVTILEALASLGRSAKDVKEIVLTHFHRDHVGSAAELAQHTPARVLAHPADAAVIAGLQHPPTPDLTDLERSLAQQLFGDSSALPGPQPEPVRVDREVHDGDLTSAGSIVALASHTPGSIGLRIAQLGVMFTGDTIAAYEEAPILGPFNVDRLAAIEALRKQAALDFDIACVGHGLPIVGNASRKLLAMIRSF
jgi:glyoxylase-like metal-dependent hydrolase (beta-lactamase superfamily II)